MESVAVRPAFWWPRALRRVDGGAVGVWVLAGGLVLYLALEGGGYDTVIHSQVGLVVWWLVLMGAFVGLLPAARLTRTAWIALGLFTAFAGWTALGISWSISSERSLADVSLVVSYLGVLALAIGLHRDRERAVRHTLGALAAAVVLVAVLALISRLRPGLIPAAGQTSAFLTGTQQRLGWPLNYWNALGALLAFGLPLLLAIGTCARRLKVQAAVLASIPVVALCGYLTFSRGGALAAAVAVIAFLALAPDRFPKLASALVAAAGSAALIAAAAHRTAIEHGLTGSVATHQGATLVIPIVLVVLGVALAQVGIGLVARHGTPPRTLVVPRRRAQVLLASGLAMLIAICLIAGVPGRISHAWQDFKHPTAPALTNYSLARFGSVSGNGRYDYWKVAVNSTGTHVLQGSGPGTFQLLWLPRAPYDSYVENAHSLYLETLAELGVIGLTLLVSFLGLILLAGVRLLMRSRYETRVYAAGATAALLAFMVSAGFDWIWQVPALPVAFLLVAAALLAPTVRGGAEQSGVRERIVARVAMVLVAIASLLAISIPLATTNAVRASQAATAHRNLALARSDAHRAVRLEPGAASAHLQLALVDERVGDYHAAVIAAQQATRDEPANWATWLILSRVQAEIGHSSAAVAAYRRSRSLNPRSPIFNSHAP